MKIGCDSMKVTYALSIPNPRMPLTFKYNTTNGVYIPTSGTTIDTTFLHTTGQVVVSQIIPGMDYGHFAKATIYNTCGDSAVSMDVTAHPFVFYPKYAFNECGNTALVTFTNTPYNNFHTSVNAPATYTFTDASNNILQSGTVTVDQNNGIFPIGDTLTMGVTYHFSITDGCGETFSSSIIVPELAPPVIILQDIFSGACIDSVVGAYRVLTAGFQNNARLILLSGPGELGSTKPEFAYSDTYTYPDTVPMVNGESFMMNNLAIGTYQYKIIDDCGNEILGSITIREDQVTSLKRTNSLVKGCPGRNRIYFGMVNGGKVTIRNIATNAILKEKEFISYTHNYLAEQYNRDSLINLFDGSYEITYQFLQSPGAIENSTQINDSDIPCWRIVDTIHVAPYQTPEMFTGNAIMCNNTINFVLMTDTSKGVAPYEYEIISGPQTFPVQNSNIFTITQPGTYTARIFDACGNASIKQITVDTISFDPIEISSSCNTTSLTFPSSIYDDYLWLMPNGQVYTGDSLVIDPITPADTGTYLISKVVDINGCRDTFYTSHHVTLNLQTTQSIQFCPGNTITIGGNTYTLPGIYTDTLTAFAGCDSIVLTHIIMAPQISDTSQVTICYGDSVEIAGQYYGIAGFYTDSVQNSGGCYDLLVTDLVVNTPSSTVNATICWGSQYAFGGNQIGQTGTYMDTLSTTGCLSIVTLNLTVSPPKSYSYTKTICEGEAFIFGGNSYTLSGTYTDTIPTPACDSTVTVTLTVLPFTFDTPDEVICAGDSLLESHLPNTSGVTYQWSPAQWTSNPNIHNPLLFPPISQVFQIIISNGICSDTLSKNVQTIPALSHLIPSDTICRGQSIQIGPNPSSPQLVYNWSPSNWLSNTSIANPIATPTSDITYVLNVHAMGNPSICATTDSVTIHVVDLSAPTIGYDEFAGCYGFSVQVNANGNPSYNYSWFTEVGNTQSGNTQTYTISYDTTITFNMVISSAGCTDTISLTKTFESSDTYWGQLVIPNVFTPNNDNINDCFGPTGVPEECYWLYVYNRWGVLMFDSNKLNKTCWEGNFMATDTKVVDGVYFWVMEIGGNEYHGTVTAAGGLGSK
jgi:gliding motility-associated-like protein